MLRAKTSTYAKMHPIAVALGLGSVVTGLVLAIYPETALTSPIVDSVTSAGIRFWGVAFIIGGIAVAYGTLRPYLPAEAGGMALLATCFGAAVLPPLLDPAIPLSPLLVTFAFLSTGTAVRSYGLTTRRIM